MYSSGSFASSIEQLEPRTLFAAVPYQISVVSGSNGPSLVIIGTSADDTIQVNKTDGGLGISDQNGNETDVSGSFASIEIHGGSGNDRITLSNDITTPALLYGDSGNDSITGGGGDDTIYAGTNGGYINGNGGNDTIIAVNATTRMTLLGGGGTDTFWYNGKGQKVGDATKDEIKAGLLHYMSSFVQPKVQAVSASPATNQVRTTLADPAVTSSAYKYQDFSSNPLFGSAGPLETDVKQGYVGDCYFLAALASVARTDPSDIRNSITSLGDNTYAVRFHRSGRDVYVRVDADLPVSGSTPAYARLGSDGSTWVALMEKAYTYFRKGARTYASIAMGWMSEAFAALGLKAGTARNVSNGQTMLKQIQSLLAAGKAVTYATRSPNGAPLIACHAYTVEAVVTDSSGNITGLQLRNPWGYDGAGNDSNPSDGVVTISVTQALKARWAVQYATV